MAMMSSPSINVAFFVAEQNAVGVAVVRDADVRAVLDDFLAHRFRVHGAAIFVDVFAVGLVVENDDFRAEFAQDAGRGFVGRAVAAIQNDFHAFERQAARETRIWQIRCSGPSASSMRTALPICSEFGRMFSISPVKTRFSISFSILSSSL